MKTEFFLFLYFYFNLLIINVFFYIYNLFLFVFNICAYALSIIYFLLFVFSCWTVPLPTQWMFLVSCFHGNTRRQENARMGTDVLMLVMLPVVVARDIPFLPDHLLSTILHVSIPVSSALVVARDGFFGQGSVKNDLGDVVGS